MEDNEFYSYHYNKITDTDFEVCGCDLQRNEFVICHVKTKRLAKYLVDHFDMLAIDEERDLFG
jgi:hypothetical protein